MSEKEEQIKRKGEWRKQNERENVRVGNREKERIREQEAEKKENERVGSRKKESRREQ